MNLQVIWNRSIFADLNFEFNRTKKLKINIIGIWINKDLIIPPIAYSLYTVHYIVYIVHYIVYSVRILHTSYCGILKTTMYTDNDLSFYLSLSQSLYHHCIGSLRIFDTIHTMNNALIPS